MNSYNIINISDRMVHLTLFIISFIISCCILLFMLRLLRFFFKKIF